MIRSCFMLGAAVALVALPAQAGNNDCGGIELESVTACALVSGCQSDCRPDTLVAACNGRCDEAANQTCVSAGESKCPGECSAGTGGGGGAGGGGESFNCIDFCEAECLEDVACTVGEGGDCEFLVANCAVRCAQTCGDNATNNCDTQCRAGVAVGCEAQAQRECLVGCGDELPSQCLQDCAQEDGALFCDGQYIAADNLPACNRFLDATYGVTFVITPSESVDLSCAVHAPGQGDPLGLFGFVGLALGVGLGARRHRRNPA